MRLLTSYEFIDVAGHPYAKALELVKKGFDIMRSRYLDSADVRIVNVYQFSEVVTPSKMSTNQQAGVIIHLTALVEISGDTPEDITPLGEDELPDFPH